MKKKLLSMLLVGAMAVSALSGCGGNAGSADKGSTDGGSGTKEASSDASGGDNPVTLKSVSMFGCTDPYK